MQIKTAMSIVAGLGLGYLFFREPEKKERLFHIVKNTLHKYKTGKELPDTKPVINYHSTYRDIWNKNKKKHESNDKPIIRSFKSPIFDSKEEAEHILSELKDLATTFNSVTVLDLNNLLKKDNTEWAWDVWGWTKDDIGKCYVAQIGIYENRPGSWAIIHLDKPHIIR